MTCKCVYSIAKNVNIIIIKKLKQNPKHATTLIANLSSKIISFSNINVFDKCIYSVTQSPCLTPGQPGPGRRLIILCNSILLRRIIIDTPTVGGRAQIECVIGKSILYIIICTCYTVIAVLHRNSTAILYY